MLRIEKGVAQRVAEILRDPRKESTVSCVILIMMALWFATMALWLAAEGNLMVHHTMRTLTTEGSAELCNVLHNTMHTNTRISMRGYPCVDIHV